MPAMKSGNRERRGDRAERGGVRGPDDGETKISQTGGFASQTGAIA